MRLSAAVKQVARLIGRPVLIVPAPVILHRLLARVFELTMTIPLIASAQVFMLAEGMTEAAPVADPVPEDLTPRTPFEDQRIRERLPEPQSFRSTDLRLCASLHGRCRKLAG
jgi:NADH dehydrogenase